MLSLAHVYSAKDTSSGGNSEAWECQCDSTCTHAVYTCVASATSVTYVIPAASTNLPSPQPLPGRVSAQRHRSGCSAEPYGNNLPKSPCSLIPLPMYQKRSWKIHIPLSKASWLPTLLINASQWDQPRLCGVFVCISLAISKEVAASHKWVCCTFFCDSWPFPAAAQCICVWADPCCSRNLCLPPCLSATVLYFLGFYRDTKSPWSLSSHCFISCCTLAAINKHP